MEMRSICRLCGQNTAITETRRPIPKLEYCIVIQRALQIDVKKDESDIHPPFICNNCRVKLETWKKNARAKKKDLKIGIKVAEFEHNKESMKASFFRHACDVATQMGYMVLKENNKHIFFEMDSRSCTAKRRVILNDDRSFSVDIFGKSVKMNGFPDHLKQEDIDRFFKISKRNICSGNEDFLEIMNSKDALYSNDGSLVATIDHISHTIRHVRCEVFIDDPNITRCAVCKAYRCNLSSMTSFFSKALISDKTAPSSCVRHDRMNCNDLKEKLANVQSERRTLKTKNHKLQKEIEKLVEKHALMLSEACSEDINRLMESTETKTTMTGLPEDSAARLLWEQQIKQANLADNRQMRWHPSMLRWCIALNNKSKSAYEFIKKSGLLALPHINTLNSYIHHTDANPGINPDILEQLLKRLPDKDGLEKDMTLIFDEMKIKSGLAYSERSGDIFGFTEVGDINQEFKEFEDRCKGVEQPDDIADHVLVLFLRGIFSNFKHPVAYYPCQGSMKGYQLHTLIWDAVLQLEFVGLRIRAMTADGAATNRSFFKMHGDDKDLVFKCCNPSSVEREVYFMSDPPHLMKTVRNNIENSHWNKKSRNLVFKEQEIKWPQCVDAYEEDLRIGKHSPGLRMLHKITYEHLHLNPSLRMKVHLATQVLSETFANAIEMMEKPGTDSLLMVIRYFDKFFDCLNVSNLEQGKRKRKPNLLPYTTTDDPRFQWLIKDFLGFLAEWEEEVEKTPNLTKAEKRRLCLSKQTLDGLRMTVLSFTEMAKLLLTETNVKYILSEKFCQDPLEEYFSKQRGAGGSNTNPTLGEFQNNYLALHATGTSFLYAQDTKKGNCSNSERVTEKTIDDTPLPKRRKNNSDMVSL